MNPVEWVNFAVFVGLALLVGGSLLGLSALLGPKHPTEEKLDPYECGAPVLTSARERFSVQFYLVAIMFMLFDIESVFLIPWAVSYQTLLKEIGTAVLFEMLVFVGILGFGLAYIWRRGVLNWF
jgi:NADH-quinone oxidoreductase subunit A